MENTKLPTTDIAFTSVSRVNGRRLAGARFGLYRRIRGADGTESWELLLTETSASDGTVAFPGIAEGDYEIRLLSAPEGYSGGDTPIVLSVDKAGELETFYFKGEKEQNLLAAGNGEVAFDVEKAAEEPEDNAKDPEDNTKEPEDNTKEPVDGGVTVEDPKDDSTEDSNRYSGGIWNNDHTYLKSPNTGE